MYKVSDLKKQSYKVNEVAKILQISGEKATLHGVLGSSANISS